MTRDRVGRILFWGSVIWSFFWIIIGFSMISSFNKLTMTEINQTVWSPTGTFYAIWALGVPIGAIVAGIGALIRSGAKGSTVWKAVGVWILGLILVTLSFYIDPTKISPPLFGIGGISILLFFFGIIWFFSKEGNYPTNSSKEGAHLKVVGHVFMLLAMWFICDIAAAPFMKVYKGEAPESPLDVMILLVLGWLFIFLGHYKCQAK